MVGDPFTLGPLTFNELMALDLPDSTRVRLGPATSRTYPVGNEESLAPSSETQRVYANAYFCRPRGVAFTGESYCRMGRAQQCGCAWVWRMSGSGSWHRCDMQPMIPN